MHYDVYQENIFNVSIIAAARYMSRSAWARCPCAQICGLYSMSKAGTANERFLGEPLTRAHFGQCIEGR